MSEQDLDTTPGGEQKQDARDPGAASASEDQATEKRAGLTLPQVDFSTFLLSLASSALVQLGEVPDPTTGKSELNLELAKHSIDIVCMLQDKIKNGLDPEETRLLEGILYELRLKYVIKAK
jgi:hypothetical protein